MAAESEWIVIPRFGFATIGLALALLGGAVQAQEWPQRSSTMVVPFVAGGGADVVARMVTAEASMRSSSST